ncbi:hypothetical protein C8J57DRAFT_1389585, partial [Mycena rebaudengoi]
SIHVLLFTFMLYPASPPLLLFSLCLPLFFSVPFVYFTPLHALCNSSIAIDLLCFSIPFLTPIIHRFYCFYLLAIIFILLFYFFSFFRSSSCSFWFLVAARHGM